MEGRTVEALAVFDRALAHSKLLFGEMSRQVANLYLSLANARVAEGRLDESEVYSRRSVYVFCTSVGNDHFETAFARTQLATILTHRGKLAEAESLLRQSLETYSRTVAPDHPYVASSEYFLGEVLLREGRLRQAEVTLTASMNRWKRAGAAPWRAARSQSALGEVLYREGRYKEAEQYLSASYDALASDGKADQDARVQARRRIAQFYQERGELLKLKSIIPPPPLPPNVAATNLEPTSRIHCETQLLHNCHE
jgi:tetratricopeptide (TPR) repeat protein